jgi:dihydroneopterin aldolase
MSKLSFFIYNAAMTAQNQTKILVRDFIVPARIGIYPHEHEAPQNICVSVVVTLKNHEIRRDDIEDTLSYEGLVAAIRALQKQHFELVETMADHLADVALMDARTSSVTVTVEKLEVYPEGRVGTEITRYR